MMRSKKISLVLVLIMMVNLLIGLANWGVSGATQETPDSSAVLFKFYDSWIADNNSITLSHPVFDGYNKDYTDTHFMTSGAGSVAGVKQIWGQQAGTESKWIAADITLQGADTYGFYINIPTTTTNGDAVGKIHFTNNSGATQTQIFDFSDLTTPGWYKIGEYNFGETTNVKIETSTNKKQIRADAVAFQKVAPGASQEPSTAPSPSTEPSVGPKFDENFNSYATGPIDITTIGWSGVDITSEIVRKSAGDNYVKAVNGSTVKKGYSSPKISSLNGGASVKGENVIASIKFNVENIADGTLLNYKTKTSQVPIDFKLAKNASDPNTFTLDYRHGPISVAAQWGTYANWNKVLNLNTWYQLIVSLNSNESTYDFYVTDADGTLIDSKKDIAVRYNVADTGNIVDLDIFMLTNFNPGFSICLDDLYIANDADFVLPGEDSSAEPSIAPSVEPSIAPSAEPSDDSTIFYFYDAIKSAEADEIFELSSEFEDEKFAEAILKNIYRGEANTAVQPQKCYVIAAKSQWVNATIPLPKEGLYTISIHNPLAHIGNESAEVITITQKDGSKKVVTFDFTQANGWYDLTSLDLGNTVKIEFGLTTKNIRLDALKFTPITELPSPIPSPSPTPTPSPSPLPDGEYRIDDENEELFRVVLPDPDNMFGELGNSDTGSSSYGVKKLHTYCSVVGAYGEYQLRYIPAGEYEIYYNFPLKHASNTTRMYIDVNDSTGKQVKEYYNQQEVPSGTWQKIGDTFTIKNTNVATLRVGKETVTGHFRMDSIKLIRVSDIADEVPVVFNVATNGVMKKGSTLTGSYTYYQGNGYESNGTELNWYRADSALSTQWTKIGIGENYTLGEADGEKYIKFEVVPKCVNPKTQFSVGTPTSVVLGPVPAIDFKPEAKNIKINGFAITLMKLTATYEYYDENGDTEGDTTYQWELGNTKDGTFTPIDNATGTINAGGNIQYTISSNDVGKYIRLAITPKNNLIGNTVYSTVLGPITNESQSAKPIADAPLIAGAGAPNCEVYAAYTFIHPYKLTEGESEYQWYVSDSKMGTYTKIEGATQKIFHVTEDHKGKYIKFDVTPVVKETGLKGNMATSQSKQIKFNLVWSDEFDYQAVDGLDPNFTEKWVSSNKPTVHILSGRYAKNVKVTDGNLKLLQYKEVPQINGQDWTSGSVSTKQKFGYGHYEARYKYAPSTGLNQSFWLMTQGSTKISDDNYEIDINEGWWPTRIRSNIHYSRPGTTSERVSISMTESFYIPGVSDMAADYHVFEMNWSEKEIILYVDGIEYRRIQNTMCKPDIAKDNLAYIYFSVAVTSGAGGVSDAIDGSEMDVDYIRYYQTDENLVVTEELSNVVTKAETAISSSKVGSNIGNYPQTAFTALEAAVLNAKTVLQNPNATQEQVNTEVDTMNAALTSFFSKMVSSGALTKDSNGIVIPKVFGKSISILNGTGNFDAYIMVPGNTFLSNDLIIRTYLPINGVNKIVELQILKNTRFVQNVNADGYVKLELPKRVDSFDVNGKLQGVIYLPQMSISNAFRVSIPSFTRDKIAYVEIDGQLKDITKVISADRQIEAELEVPASSMAVAEKSFGDGVVLQDLVIWGKYLSPIVLYEDIETSDPGTIGNSKPKPFPSHAVTTPQPSPNVSLEPTDPGSSPSDFEDISGHWAEKEIKDFASNNIIKGVSETEFLPDETITRAEFIAIIVRAMGLDLADYSNSFYDVKSSDWFANEVQTALNHSIISKDTNFRPNDTITREEMTKMMVEALLKVKNVDTLNKADLSKFKDKDEISDWAKEYVAMALDAGLIQGMSEDEFAPKESATRAQAVVMIYRFLSLIAKG